MIDEVFEIENCVLIKYNGGAVAEIPEGVVEIGEYSFTGCEDVECVIVPSSVKRIGQQTFRGCSILREINLPEGLERIARFAFCECGSLEQIVIPEGVTEIGNSAFRSCDMLKTASLPDSVSRIGESAFSDCTSLSSINIPKGVDVIRKRSFSSCRSLTEIELPEGITEICDHAFDNCAQLRSVKLPDTLVSIGKHSFSGCSALTDISIPDGVEYIGSSAFYRTPLIDNADSDFAVVGDGILISCKSTDETVILPEGIKTIGENAFTGNDSTRKAVLPESAVRISDFAFERCYSLESVHLPAGLEDIGSRAFIDCSALNDVVLPDGLHHIGSDAFYGTAFLAGFADDIIILENKYLIRAAVSCKRYEIPEGIELIADNAFLGSSAIEEVIIPESVRYIGSGAFKWLTELKKVIIPDTVISVGSEGFISSSELNAVIFPASLTLGENVFSHSSKLTLVNGDRSFSVTLTDDSGADAPVIAFAAAPDAEKFFDIAELSESVPAAVCYADMLPECNEYLKTNISSAIDHAVETDDTELLQKLLSFGFADEAQIQGCIENAISAQKHEPQVLLMRYKNDHFGEKSVDELIDSKFSL